MILRLRIVKKNCFIFFNFIKVWVYKTQTKFILVILYDFDKGIQLTEKKACARTKDVLSCGLQVDLIITRLAARNLEQNKYPSLDWLSLVTNYLIMHFVFNLKLLFYQKNFNEIKGNPASFSYCFGKFYCHNGLDKILKRCSNDYG